MKISLHLDRDNTIVNMIIEKEAMEPIKGIGCEGMLVRLSRDNIKHLIKQCRWCLPAMKRRK